MFTYLSTSFSKLFLEAANAAARRREARQRAARFQRLRLEVLEGRIVLDAYSYIGPAGGAWTNVANWDDDTTGLPATQLPGSGDTVTIPGGAYCVLNSTTQQTVAGLTVQGQLDLGSKLSVTTMTTPGGIFNLLTGGELDVQSSADFGGSGTLQGEINAGSSTVTFDPGSSMVLGNGISLLGGNFYIYGTVTCNAALSDSSTFVLDDNGSTTAGSLTGAGSMTVSSDFDWDGGYLGLSGGITFQPDADLQIQGPDAKSLLAGTLTNQCNASSIGGTGILIINAGATFDNLGNPTCDVTISNIYVFSGMGGNGAFINDADGFFDEQGTTTISGNFINYGYLEVGAGTSLTLSSSGPAGPDSVLDGTLILDGELTLEGEVSSPSGFLLDAGSGTLQVGNGSISGTLTVASGYEALLTGATLEVTSSGTLTGDGTLDNNSGVVQLDLGSSTLGLGAFKQSPSGQLTLQADAFGYSSLNVSGNANLTGTLNLDLLDGYQPTSGTMFTVVTAGSISHQFNTTPPNMTATYGSASLTLTEN